MTDDRVREAHLVVGNYVEPYLGMPLSEAKAVNSVRLDGETVVAEVRLGFPLGPYGEELARALESRLSDAGMRSRVEVSWEVLAQAAPAGRPPLPGIRNVLAIASGKGGVGKSTVAVNLAVSLALDGAAVGLIDADIYGPSDHIMLGITGKPELRGKKFVPIKAHGVHVMSIGFLIEPNQAVIWRGPMAVGAVQQFMTDTLWGELDYLLFDLPPGTGDIHLSLAQNVPLSGAVVVTTPQDIALADVRKACTMFAKVKVPVLGVVENMSYHTCRNCGHKEEIFASGGGRRTADELGVPLLAEVPLYAPIRAGGDAGTPIVVGEPESEQAGVFRSAARLVAARLSTLRYSETAAPEIEIDLGS
jgi:ATP-binding protein involved in chromosome partitioning